MDSKFVYPQYKLDGFNCPHCRAYAHQCWSDVIANGFFNKSAFYENAFEGNLVGFRAAKCSKCSNISIWLGDKMIYPESASVPEPNCDLSEDIKADYREAASILNQSARGSAALLRLCLQKLCKQLGLPGESLNSDIETLVQRGLSSDLQKAMDSLRVVGNNAVHPGYIDLKDNRDIAVKLFALVNFVAEKMISDKKRVEEFYSSVIPEDTKTAISQRHEKANRKKKTTAP